MNGEQKECRISNWKTKLFLQIVYMSFFCVSLCLSLTWMCLYIFMYVVYFRTSVLYHCINLFSNSSNAFVSEHIFWKFLFFIIFDWAMYTRACSRPSHPFLFHLFHSSILTEMISLWMKCYMHSGVCACVSGCLCR